MCGVRVLRCCKPLSRGEPVSAISHIGLEDLTNTYKRQSVPDVKPWIERDIEGQQLAVKMQAFIGMLLLRCCVDSSYGDMDEKHQVIRRLPPNYRVCVDEEIAEQDTVSHDI